MTISGLNFNTATNFNNLNNRSDATQNQQSNNANAGRFTSSVNQSNQTGGPQTINSDGSQITATSPTRIQSPTQTDRTTETVVSRRDPAETEAFANQFRLQQDSEPANPQVREFLAVANFEQRDQLAQSTGIDVFV